MYTCQIYSPIWAMYRDKLLNIYKIHLTIDY